MMIVLGCGGASSLHIPFLLTFIIVSSFLFGSHCAYLQPLHATAHGGATWTNNLQSLLPLTEPPLSVRPILVTTNISYDGLNLMFGCGFLSYVSDSQSFFFGVFLAIYKLRDQLLDLQIVWSANRNQSVRENATLRLTSIGNLTLTDADGSLVWSTRTSSQDFQGLTIQDSGNLVLLDKSNGTLWQSFDHPTDTIARGQKLKVGQKIIANISPTNTSQGIFYGTLSPHEFVMFMGTSPPVKYFEYPTEPTNVSVDYILVDEKSMVYYREGGSNPIPVVYLDIPKNALYFKIASDGHMQFYSFGARTGGSVIDYLSDFTDILTQCDYPTACGEYGICADGNCVSCPKGGNGADEFRAVDESGPKSGCRRVDPLVCSDTSPTKGAHFLELDHVSYFTYLWENASIPELVSRDYCKSRCLENCSCEAAFFRYDGTDENSSHGYCHLEQKVFSLRNSTNPTDQFYNSTAYVKVQPSSKDANYLLVIIFVSGAGVLGLVVLLWVYIHKIREDKDEDPEDSFPAGMPRRYSFNDLEKATEIFKTKLGSGGFGSVYEGIISDGSKVAVKRLDRSGQGTKEFRAEVETLGNIHHFNLVRLKGFCAEKSHRILVYEHLQNGSLDKWIFLDNSQHHVLEWKTRSKIALHIARGLTYLHEECQERIIHFDIKPQNILLDENFNAKVSDFGLSKLINRDQTEVITMMRGTPGYMAPELLNGLVTEKADTYSFGVVVVEIVSGKKNRELTISEYNLLSLLQRKAEEGSLLELVDRNLKEEGMDVEEMALKMIRVGMWCMQEDFGRRPAMSSVVKALEGLIELTDIPLSDMSPGNISQQWQASSRSGLNEGWISDAAVPSVLSGPR